MGEQQKTKQSARWWPTWAASQAEPEIKHATLESGVREACFRFQHCVHWSLEATIMSPLQNHHLKLEIVRNSSCLSLKKKLVEPFYLLFSTSAFNKLSLKAFTMSQCAVKV